MVDPLTKKVRGLPQHFGTLERGGAAPDLEAGRSGVECTVQVGAFGVGYGADLLAGRRVEHGEGFARLGRPPLPIDEQVYVGIGRRHGGSLVWTAVETGVV